MSGDRPGEDDLVRLIRGLVRRRAPGLLTGVGDDCAVLERVGTGGEGFYPGNLYRERAEEGTRNAHWVDGGAKVMAESGQRYFGG